MKTQAIVPAVVDFADMAAVSSAAFGDLHQGGIEALKQARQVLLGACGLPGRWAQRPRFVILETGFGSGHNFLATWDAWLQDPARCRRLIFISIEKHPLQAADLARAQQNSALPALAAQLLTAWPPLTPNLHRLSFEQGRVQLLLCLGDVHLWMRELVAEVDAFYLNDSGRSNNLAMWDSHVLKALGRRAAVAASAASNVKESLAAPLREGLTAAGFSAERLHGDADKDGIYRTRFAPLHSVQRPLGREPLAAQAQHALIIGAGLAGAACAWALAQQGIRSTVIDTHAAPAQASSGNPGGLYHGTLNPDDGLHARFNRAAALETQRVLCSLPPLPWHQRGLLRLETQRSEAQMQALIKQLGLPAGYVQALSAAAAAQLSGLDLQLPAWLYPGGGALPPPAYVAALLAAAAAKLLLNQPITRLQRCGNQWQAWGADGQLVAEAPLVVLAGGVDGFGLLHDLAPDVAALLRRTRGQLSHLKASSARPNLPVAGLGYAIADPAAGLWCGATSQDEAMQAAMDSTLCADDHQHNLQQWGRLAHVKPPLTAQAGRVAWRLAAPDRLPLVGGLAEPGYSGRQDQARFIPRLPGLAICMAMGSRGITWAALCGQVLAAQVSGAPCPLEASLLDAIDPLRFAVRAAR
jgi:tRNA 5-methylaminomethyl-2-thiouridine biosynthesis bifunctional protein